MEDIKPEKKKVGVGFGVMMVRDGKILLGRRHGDPYKANSELHGEWSWTMPGGKLEFGESFEDGARREVKEETGMDLGSCERYLRKQRHRSNDAHFVTIGLFSEDFKGEPSSYGTGRDRGMGMVSRWTIYPTPLFFPSAKVIK